MRSLQVFLVLCVLATLHLCRGFVSLANAVKQHQLIPQRFSHQQADGTHTESRFDAVERLGKLPIHQFAKLLDEALEDSQWFVTGRVDAKFFSKHFFYLDPDITLFSLDAYANDVKNLYDQEVTTAEILRTDVDAERHIITVTWRLSGKANLGPGLFIKPNLVYTSFHINPETGLIQHQEDRYSLQHWDILLSGVFPYLAGRDTSTKAPPVRIETKSSLKVAPVEAWASRSGIQSYFGSSTVTQLTQEEEAQEEEDSLVDVIEDHDVDATPAELYAYSDTASVQDHHASTTKSDDAKPIKPIHSTLHRVPWGQKILSFMESRNFTAG